MTRHGGYRDEDLLASDFPDPRMPEKQHRPLRHEYFRRKERKKRERKFFNVVAKIVDEYWKEVRK